MAGYMNNMSKLLNKVESRLGLIPLTPYLPKEFSKEAWAEVVKTDSLVTFSRYYPRKVKFKVTPTTAPKKGGWHYIDEDYVGSQEILGVGDIDWSDFTNSNSIGLAQQFGYGLADVGVVNLSMGDISNLINRANYASMFTNSVYPEFESPNKLRLVAVGNKDVKIGNFVIDLHVKHNDDLTSISPTKMETFEALAQADIANFLYQNLKYWEGLETVLANADLKLSQLENEGSKRENVVDELKQNYVSAGNDAIPLFVVQ